LKFLNELAASNDRNFKFTALVVRFRSSPVLGSRSGANFGI
jgi:hypothetical protein